MSARSIGEFRVVVDVLRKFRRAIPLPLMSVELVSWARVIVAETIIADRILKIFMVLNDDPSLVINAELVVRDKHVSDVFDHISPSKQKSPAVRPGLK